MANYIRQGIALTNAVAVLTKGAGLLLATGGIGSVKTVTDAQNYLTSSR
jgi:hypothetical protein